MIIGVILTTLFLILLPLALKGIDVEVKDYSTKAIFSRVWDIVKQWFNIKNIIRDAQQENKSSGNPYIEISPDTNNQVESSDTAYPL